MFLMFSVVPKKQHQFKRKKEQDTMNTVSHRARILSLYNNLLRAKLCHCFTTHIISSVMVFYYALVLTAQQF